MNAPVLLIAGVSMLLGAGVTIGLLWLRSLSQRVAVLEERVSIGTGLPSAGRGLARWEGHDGGE